MSYKWIADEQLIHSWGSWMGRFHNASRLFSADRPEIAKRIQQWYDVHDSVMKGYALSEEDATFASSDVGVLHGDVNISNFHFDGDKLHVFDWDQVQQGLWELDVAQAVLTVVMLH